DRTAHRDAVGGRAGTVVIAMKPARTPARRIGRLAAVVVGVFAVAAIAGARAAWSHPLHTTLTEIALDSADGTMRLTIRAFADDFSAVVARDAGTPRTAEYRVPDAEVAGCVAATGSVEE